MSTQKESFFEKRDFQISRRHHVCVGLDTVYDRIPIHIRSERICESIFLFNKCIIDATKDIVGYYKPNFAFYLRHGQEGIAALKATFDYIKNNCSEYRIPGIFDAKFGDIGNTNDGYAEFSFDYLGADAVTVSPYFGEEALRPFLDRDDKGIIVLCRTSNKGSNEFQDLEVYVNELNFKKLYRIVAENVLDKWQHHNNCLLVVGATNPYELKRLRESHSEAWFLVPGIGAQGAKLEDVIKIGMNASGSGLILNSSREILYASKGEDFEEAARNKVLEMNNEIENLFSPVE